MAKAQHWMDELVEAMRGDRHELTEAVKDTFTDLRPLRSATRKLTPQQELKAFLGMEQPDRQRMAMEMGPDMYGQFVMDKVNQLVKVMGPAAQQLLPYLMAPIDTGEQELDRGTVEAELMAMLGTEE